MWFLNPVFNADCSDFDGCRAKFLQVSSICFYLSLQLLNSAHTKIPECGRQKQIPTYLKKNRLGLVQVNLSEKLFFLQNMGRTCCVQKLFRISETISVHNMFSPGLSLEFSCIELVIQSTICSHIVG